MSKVVGLALLDVLLYFYIKFMWSMAVYPMHPSAFKAWLFINLVLVGLWLAVRES